MTSKELVLKELLKLNTKDLTEIIQVATNLLEGTSSRPKTLWLDAINQVLGSRARFKSGTLKRFNEAEQFLDSLPCPKQVQRSAARRLLVELLVSDLKARRVVPAPGIIVRNLGRVAEVFDSAYPGYRSAGLTYLILGRKP